jgi:hypothetical protein
MEYAVLSTDTDDEGEDLTDLVDRVNDMISIGWRPQGGISVCSYEMIKPEGTVIQFMWMQAIVRDTPKEQPNA